MSSKKQKETRSKAKSQTLVKPAGPVPQPLVMTRHEREMKERRGKGFSWGELGAAGINHATAMNWGLSIDPRRRSVLDGNVAAVKTWASHAKSKKAESEVSKAEREVKKVEEEVKEGAAEVKKEVSKAAKKVEKKASKVAKEAEKAAAKAKPRAKKKPEK